MNLPEPLAHECHTAAFILVMDLLHRSRVLDAPAISQAAGIFHQAADSPALAAYPDNPLAALARAPRPLLSLIEGGLRKKI